LGKNLGVEIFLRVVTVTGKFQPYRSGISLCRLTVELKSYPIWSDTLREPNRDSKPPKPVVVLEKFELKVAKSANLKLAFAFAFQPFSLSKPDTRNSFNQNSAFKLGEPGEFISDGS
jgi:hypothetical protein